MTFTSLTTSDNEEKKLLHLQQNHKRHTKQHDPYRESLRIKVPIVVSLCHSHRKHHPLSPFSHPHINHIHSNHNPTTKMTQTFPDHHLQNYSIKYTQPAESLYAVKNPTLRILTHLTSTVTVRAKPTVSINLQFRSAVPSMLLMFLSDSINS